MTAPTPDYYKILDVAPTATPQEIRQAYEIAKRTYSNDSLATYSLFDADDRQAMMARIDEAFRALDNPETRRFYDQSLARPEGAASIQSAPASASAPPPKPAAPPGQTEIPTHLKGADLKALREQLGVSLQTIADRTRINIKYLMHLEADEHKKLPNPVFVRSYLMQYALALKLNPDKVLSGYMSTMPKEDSLK